MKNRDMYLSQGYVFTFAVKVARHFLVVVFPDRHLSPLGNPINSIQWASLCDLVPIGKSPSRLPSSLFCTVVMYFKLKK